MDKPVSTTADRLASILLERGLKPVDLHVLTGISKPSISQYMSGAVKPKQDRIYMMAKALDVDAVWLMGYDVPKKTIKVSASFDTARKIIPKAKNIVPFTPSRVPLVGRIAAGTPILAEQNIDGYENLADGVQADFCLQVQGDSMIGANIHNGDIVFIRQQAEVEDGEIAAVLVDDSATLKRFYRHDGAVELRPENPRYRSMIFTADNCSNFRVLGKAVALQTLIE